MALGMVHPQLIVISLQKACWEKSVRLMGTTGMVRLIASQGGWEFRTMWGLVSEQSVHVCPGTAILGFHRGKLRLMVE